MKFNTLVIHGNRKADRETGATAVPIYQTASFAYQTAEELADVFEGKEAGFIYSRLGNPTVAAFENRVTALEKGLGAVACASGMSAISSALLNFVTQGSELIAGSGLFGGTFSLFETLRDFGINTKYAKDSQAQSFAELITPQTKAIFIETIGNPKMDVPDIAEIAQVAKDNGIVLIIDSTVTTPYMVRPLALGANIVIHSTSKYINGTGNSIGGIIVDGGKFNWPAERYPEMQEFRKKFGPFAYLAKLRKNIFKDFGSCLSPFNAYLNTLGMETLGLRMQQACNNAYQLAHAMASHAKVANVNYPGLADNEFHQLATKQYGGKYGAILTLRLGSKANAFKFINQLQLACNLANIGDTRTLIIHPASTIYAPNTPDEKEKMGVYEDMVRVSVGIEDVEDLLADFNRALDNL